MAEVGAMYAMMRGGRAITEGAGAGKPQTFRQSLQSLRSEVSNLKSTANKTLSSIRENVGKFSQGFRENAFRGKYAQSGGLQNLFDGVEGGIRNVARQEGITLRATFEEGMNLRDFSRKVNRLENKIKNGDVLSNIPHGVSKAERSAATRSYRSKLTNRIEKMYKNRPEMRENALRKLAESDIDHILDLQLGGTNTPRNFKTLHSRTNQRLGSQFSTRMPNGRRVPIVGIEALP